MLRYVCRSIASVHSHTFEYVWVCLCSCFTSAFICTYIFLLRRANTNTHSQSVSMCVCVYCIIQLNFEWANTPLVDVYVSMRVCMYACTHTIQATIQQCRYVRCLCESECTKRTIVFVQCTDYLFTTHSFGMCVSVSGSQLSPFDVSKTVWFSPFTHAHHWTYISRSINNVIHWESTAKEWRS